METQLISAATNRKSRNLTRIAKNTSKMRSTPQAIPSLPSAAPTLGEHLVTKALPAPSPPCSCSSAQEALPRLPLPSTALGGYSIFGGFSQRDTNRERCNSHHLLREGEDRGGRKLIQARRACSLLSHNAVNPCFQ